jgi:hypothetical protein
MPAQVSSCRRSSSSLRLPGSPVQLVSSPPLLHTSSPQLCSGLPRLLLPVVTATPRVRVCWGLYKPPSPRPTAVVHHNRPPHHTAGRAPWILPSGGRQAGPIYRSCVITASRDQASMSVFVSISLGFKFLWAFFKAR